jgi:hypothetical protein
MPSLKFNLQRAVLRDRLPLGESLRNRDLCQLLVGANPPKVLAVGALRQPVKSKLHSKAS